MHSPAGTGSLQSLRGDRGTQPPRAGHRHLPPCWPQALGGRRHTAPGSPSAARSGPTPLHSPTHRPARGRGTAGAAFGAPVLPPGAPRRTAHLRAGPAGLREASWAPRGRRGCEGPAPCEPGWRGREGRRAPPAHAQPLLEPANRRRARPAPGARPPTAGAAASSARTNGRAARTGQGRAPRESGPAARSRCAPGAERHRRCP